MLETGANGLESVIGAHPWCSTLSLIMQCIHVLIFRKVNFEIKVFPIPRLEDCIHKIRNACFVSKFDLLKGNWEVTLTDRAKYVSAFITSEALNLCRVLPFRIKNAPATFQRLINKVTAGLENFVTNIDNNN